MTMRPLAEELFAALAEWGVQVDGDDPLDASLIGSGALDSLGLFNLSLWIEEKVGHPINVVTFDLAAEWETPRRIVRFVESMRDAAPP